MLVSASPRLHRRRIAKGGLPRLRGSRLPDRLICLLRPGQGHHRDKETPASTTPLKTTLGPSAPCGITSTQRNQALQYEINNAVPLNFGDEQFEAAQHIAVRDCLNLGSTRTPEDRGSTPRAGNRPRSPKLHPRTEGSPHCNECNGPIDRVLSFARED